MSRHGEITLIQHLTDRDSVATLVAEGLAMECIPSEDLRKVVAFACNYFFSSGRSKAPSEAVITTEFGDMLSDHEITLKEPDDSIEWAIDDLKGSYVHHQVASLNKRFAASMAEADTGDKLDVLNVYATEFIALANKLEDRQARVDLRDALPDRMLAYEARALDREMVYGMRFGLSLVDGYTRGIHPGELAILAAGPKVGKAQPLDTPVLTPTGWVRMGDIRPGDRVVGLNGRPITVTSIHPQGEVDIYRVVLSDGSSTEACGDHLWSVETHGNSVDKVRTTLEIRDLLLDGKDRHTYLPVVEPVEYDLDPTLPLDPRLLGLLLGDGCFRGSTPTFTSGDQELLDEVGAMTPVSRKTHQSIALTEGKKGKGVVNLLTETLKEMGLWGKLSVEKSIPDEYLHSSVGDRMALLSGLLDADGGMDGRSCTLYTSSPFLRDGVVALVQSLGGVAKVREKPGEHRTSYALRIRLPHSLGCPFRLGRKVADWNNGCSKRPPSRKIVAVEFVGRKQAQCITVDAEDHLYVTEGFIVTHNSFFVDYVALEEWKAGRKVALFTLENSVEMTLDRIAGLATGASQRGFLHGDLEPEEVESVRNWIDEVQASDLPLHVIQPPPGHRTAESIVRQAQVLDADTLIIDQLSFMETTDVRQPRYLQIREITHTLKAMISSGRDRMPCLLAHQINREGVKAAEKFDYLSMEHLAEGGETERTADWVFGLYRSAAEVVAQELKFQTLAARREEPRHFQLRWSIDAGHVNVLSEVRLGETTSE